MQQMQQGSRRPLPGRSEGDCAREYLQSLCGGNGYPYSEAMTALLALGSNAVPSLVAALASGDRKMRYQAAIVLGRLGDERACVPLMIALHSTDTHLRAGAAYALGELRDLRAVLPLIDALQSTEQTGEGNTAVLCSLVAALGRLGDLRAIGPLIDRLTAPDSAWEVRYYLATVLGRMGDTRAVLPLIELLADVTEDSCVRCSAATALGRLGDARAVMPLITCLQYLDNDWDLRSRAATALGELGDLRAVAPLQNALKDSNRRVRQVAARALCRLPGPHTGSQPPAARTAVGREQGNGGRVEMVEAVVAMRTAEWDRRSVPNRLLQLVQHLHALRNRLFVRLRL